VCGVRGVWSGLVWSLLTIIIFRHHLRATCVPVESREFHENSNESKIKFVPLLVLPSCDDFELLLVLMLSASAWVCSAFDSGFVSQLHVIYSNGEILVVVANLVGRGTN